MVANPPRRVGRDAGPRRGQSGRGHAHASPALFV